MARPECASQPGREALHQAGVERGHIMALSMEARLEWLVIAEALAKLSCSILE
ncbi:hypothetical protein [Burkholderia cenocepacia]|uniref:hypothetical protein n=1 Tax=Burkholderia cenocepacia TaxID=95486 RepID=UPI002AB70EE0|nr:hypothetical protein [Burkholderia cenocepacia]